MTNSYDDMTRRKRELSLEIQSASSRVAALRREMGRLKELIIEAGGAEREVTEHAILRYLERYKGVDVQAAINELRDLMKDAEKMKDGEHYRSKDGNVVMVIGEGGHIITVLTPEQSEKFKCRGTK